MKLLDLLVNQNIIIQLSWGNHKIEFYSNVVEKGQDVVYVTPYMHNNAELQLNVVEGTGVICNVFADDLVTGQRISWRNVELTTVGIHGRILYCIKTHGFNNVANLDDRRHNERTVVQVDGVVSDDNNESTNVTIHDISDVGISFYAPESYSPKLQQIKVAFTDVIDDKTFEVEVECAISRMSTDGDHITVGCKLVGENKDYHLYRFIRHLRGKSKNKLNVLDDENAINKSDSNAETADVAETKAANETANDKSEDNIAVTNKE